MNRGRQPAGGGVRNPPSRGAVYEQRTYGSVGAGTGNRPGYPTGSACRVSARRQHGGYQVALTLLVLATAAC
jgi:hypothetical protein